MPEFTSFAAIGVQPADLSALIVEYVALEQARVHRRRLIKRWGLGALGVATVGLGLHWPWLSFSATALLLPPALAWIAELQRECDLTRRLEATPGVTLDAAEPTASERPASGGTASAM